MNDRPRFTDSRGHNIPRFLPHVREDGTVTQWTDERIEQVRKLAYAGKSAREAGAIMETSASALISLGRRNDFRFEAHRRINGYITVRTWDEARIEQLRSLAASGVSKKNAALIMGVARGSLEHWRDKLKIKFNGPNQFSDRAPRIRKDRPTPKQKAPQARPVPFEPPPDGGITIIELKQHSCRYPFGDPTDLDTFRYCGASIRAEGYSYCQHHHKLAYEGFRRKRAA